MTTIAEILAIPSTDFFYGIFTLNVNVDSIDVQTIPLSGNKTVVVTFSDGTGSLPIKMNDDECMDYGSSIVVGQPVTLEMLVIVPESLVKQYEFSQIIP